MLNTVKDFIVSLKDTTLSHVQVNDCHIGQISDIENPKDGILQKYPYVFYILDRVTFTGVYVLDITCIVMSQVQDEEDVILGAQSDAIDIISDIVAKYKQEGKLSPTFEVVCVPFVERFESTTAGASAQIRFEIKRPLTTCNGQFQ